MITSPAQAFAAQTSLFDWLQSSDALSARLAFLRLYTNKGTDKDTMGVLDLSTPPSEVDLQGTLAHMSAEARMVRDGTPVFVTSEAMDLVDEAVEEMPSEVMLYQDLPMDHFVLWFERPLEYHPHTIGSDGQQHVEGWNLDAIGIRYSPGEIYVKNEFDNSQPRNLIVGQDEAADLSLTDGVLVYAYVSHANIPKEPEAGVGMWSQIKRKDFGPYGLIDYVGVAFDVDWAQRDIDSPARKLHKWLIALMRLMGEHIELQPTGVPRAMRRGAVRSGRRIPLQGYLSILHLRDVVYATEEDETVEARRLRWKHRVRGHWQRFYCSTKGYPVGHPKAYRHAYVNSYVRGPGDLIESHRVVVVDR